MTHHNSRYVFKQNTPLLTQKTSGKHDYNAKANNTYYLIKRELQDKVYILNVTKQ